MKVLQAAREKLYSTLSKEQKKHIERSDNTIEAIFEVVDSSTYQWRHRSSEGHGAVASVKEAFHRSCAGLDQYSMLLKMMPESSEYTSVFVGALKTVIMVSHLLPELQQNRYSLATGVHELPDDGTETAGYHQ